MSRTLPAIKFWNRIFFDTSFIIDCLTDADKIRDGERKKECENASLILSYFQTSTQKVTWVTSSIVLSELTKFEDQNLVRGLQDLFQSPEVEIINFTKKEAQFIVNDMVDYVEPDHINRYVKQLQKEISEIGVFNPKGYINADARIIACAKSKSCDVVLTSDRYSFF